MDNDSFVYLDTSAIDKAIDMKDDILNGYRKIGEEYNRIVNSVDLDEVKRIAQEELGMHYATEGQIIKYTDAIGDYVKQYSDIE